MLKETFITLLGNYTDNLNMINELWAEIETSYSGKGRYYHTLEHLQNLLEQLSEMKGDLQNWDTLLFTLFYHDVVYSALRSDNEERSVDLAEQRMAGISVPAALIANCKQQILATKSHVVSDDHDTNYFTDADLAILGQPQDEYERYYKNIRKEYSIYPDIVYNPGRKKVLQHFLAMNRIFKTDLFYSKYEIQAKQNLQRELDSL